MGERIRLKFDDEKNRLLAAARPYATIELASPVELGYLYAIIEFFNQNKNRKDMVRWIPVEERLPDEPIECDAITTLPEYIVTIAGAEYSTVLHYVGNDEWIDDEGNYYNVLAWMPLPDAYKGVAE